MKQNEWIDINNEEDIEVFMSLYGGFHDGCIKEIKYISGMYVNEDLSMRATNSERNLSIIFQRQFKNPTVIEMMFEKIECLSLNPWNEEYDGIIYGAYMCFEDSKIVWFDYDGFSEEDGYKIMYDDSNVTWVRATSVKYRVVESYIGKNGVYTNREIK